MSSIEEDLRPRHEPQALAGRLHPHLDEIRASIVGTYRKRRETPREGGDPANPRMWEDPAPDWVWQTVDAVLGRATTEDHGRAMTLAWEAVKWCEKGAPNARALHFRTVISLWPGPKLPAIEAFLEAARKSKAGRTVERKPFTLTDAKTELHGTTCRIEIQGEPRTLARICDHFMNAARASGPQQA